MAVEYFYTAFMFQEVEPDVLQLAIALDEELMYHLFFDTIELCQGFQGELHRLGRDIKDDPIDQQVKILHYILFEDPLHYDFQLVGMDEVDLD